MNYKFDVMVALTYEDKDIEVEVDLSDEEVAKIKKYVSESTASAVEKNEEDYSPEPSLLLILEESDEVLFGKFWGVIMPPVFVELLIDGIDNYGGEIKLEEDNFADYRKANFDELYDMYGDSIEIEHSSDCICRIPDWAKEK